MSQPTSRCQHDLRAQGVPTSSTTGMPLIHQALKLVPATGHGTVPQRQAGRHGCTWALPQAGKHRLKSAARPCRRPTWLKYTACKPLTQHDLRAQGVPTSSTTGMPVIHQALKLEPAAGHSAAQKAGRQARLQAGSGCRVTLPQAAASSQQPALPSPATSSHCIAQVSLPPASMAQVCKGVPGSSTTGMPLIHQVLRLIPTAGHGAAQRAGWQACSCCCMHNPT